MEKLAMLVNSCNLYEDAWNPFFQLLKIQWPEFKYNIYLNTETKSYSCDFLKVQVINSGNEASWTARLRTALDQIDAEYILFCLEDFFLMDPVDTAKFDTIMEEMQQNQDVGFVFFPPQGVSYSSDKKIGKCFFETSRYQKYRANACLGLWRKEFLLQMLYLDGSPWDFEHNSRRLSLLSKYKCCFLAEEYAAVWPYSILTKFGYGITQRKWLENNHLLFEKHGIEVNFDRLGILDPEIVQEGVERFNERYSEKRNPFARKFRKIRHKVGINLRHLADCVVLKPGLSKYTKQLKQSGDKK